MIPKAQITFKIIQSALWVYDGRLLFLHFNYVFDLSVGVNRTDLGVYLSAELVSRKFLLESFCRTRTKKQPTQYADN